MYHIQEMQYSPPETVVKAVAPQRSHLPSRLADELHPENKVTDTIKIIAIHTPNNFFIFLLLLYFLTLYQIGIAVFDNRGKIFTKC